MNITHDITDGHQMLIPLYHGTSRIFLASIEQYGLGGKNPNNELRSHECLSDLLTIMQKHSWFDDESLAANEWTVQTMVSQRVTSGGSNFRHGNAYLSPSVLTAKRYALSYRYGSELLSCAVCLLEGLEKHDRHLTHEVSQNYSGVANLRGIQHEPLLVEATHVPMISLRSENGEDASVEIEKMRTLMDGIDPSMYDLMWQQSNFELVIPIHAQELKYPDIGFH